MSWAVALMVVLVIAVLIPWAIAELRQPSRDWIRRLRKIEAGRRAQAHDEYQFRRFL